MMWSQNAITNAAAAVVDEEDKRKVEKWMDGWMRGTAGWRIKFLLRREARAQS